MGRSLAGVRETGSSWQLGVKVRAPTYGRLRVARLATGAVSLHQVAQSLVRAVRTNPPNCAAQFLVRAAERTECYIAPSLLYVTVHSWWMLNERE
jgi:hypothetical protein